ncbi:transglycosylase SLT domain-containing protein [Acetobacter oeni]|nr:transglycosylase SLT domain-containing protein [Acetobacter oeni]
MIAVTAGLSACSAAPQTGPAVVSPPAWPTEQQATTAAVSDDVAARLTVWLRLTGPGDPAIPAKTYADFLATRPVWPRWHMIELRYQAALAAEPDDAVASALCGERPPATAKALSRCVGVAGKTPAMRDAARAIWRNGAEGAGDAALVRLLFAADLTPGDSWERFLREERTGQLTAAAQTVSSLPADRAGLAAARLAFRRNDADAETALSALPASEASDPMLVVDHARWLRKAQREDDELALWKTQGFAVESEAPASARGAFWTERDALARDLLAAGRAQDAFTLADDTTQTDDTKRWNAAFLAGWVSLRQLHNPAQAEAFFRKMTESRSLLTRSGGYYWLGRAHAEMGNMSSATADWQRAAETPQTFYGQMAVAALAHGGTTLLSPAQPCPALRDALQRWQRTTRGGADVTATTVHVDGSDLAQAAQILVSWNDRAHAREFLNLLLAQDNEPSDQRAVAELAVKLGIPDIGVAVARKASMRGVSMPDMGWPEPFAEPSTDLPRGLPLGLMRQESNFNPDAVSSSGAIGLMQLLPGTARDMARATGAGSLNVAELHAPSVNIQLGTAYLDRMYKKFDGVVPYTAAAYNAGPHRVSQWLEAGGDPARTGADQDALIDWIEQIPYSETRSYVKRVWESMVVYSVRDQG